MRAWLKHHFTSPVIGHVADWATVVGLAIAFLSWTGLMAWAASSISVIAEQGWGAILFTALAITCLLAFAARALLPILVYFRPSHETASTSATSPVPVKGGFDKMENTLTKINQSIHNFDLEIATLLNFSAYQSASVMLERLLNQAPHEISDPFTISDDLTRTHDIAEKYIELVGNTLGYGTHRRSTFVNVISIAIGDAEREIEAIPVQDRPNEVNPMHLRRYAISNLQCLRVIKFLQNEKREVDDNIITQRSSILDKCSARQ